MNTCKQPRVTNYAAQMVRPGATSSRRALTVRQPDIGSAGRAITALNHPAGCVEKAWTDEGH